MTYAVSTASRARTLQAASATTPIRAPYQQRSSLSIYQRRGEMRRRYSSSSSSPETESTSAAAPQCGSELKAAIRLHVYVSVNDDHETETVQDNDDEDIDAIVEEWKLRTIMHVQ